MKRIILALFLSALPVLHGQTIAEKKAGTSGGGGADLSYEMQKFLIQVNKELQEWHTKLDKLYSQVIFLYNQDAPEESYKELLDQINQVKENILILENSWRKMALQGTHEESYGLWHQPDTTLGQLVIDYGSQNFVYLMTGEIAALKLSVNSNLPIPRSSWNEMLELILTQNGIGIKQLNPYLRQLYLIKDNHSGIKLITNKREDLEIFPQDTRVAFMLSPEPSEVRRFFAFLDKFVNPNSTVLQMIGRDILIVGPVGEIQDLLKMYDFVVANRGDKEYKVISLHGVDAEEMSKILAAIFDQFSEGHQTPGRPPGLPFPPPPPHGKEPPRNHFGERGSSKPQVEAANGLKIIPLAHIAQAIFLVGTKEEIKKAEEIVRQVENQIGEASEKVVFVYTTKHSDAEELAEILEKVYSLMITTGAGIEKPEDRNEEPPTKEEAVPTTVNVDVNKPNFLAPVREYAEGYYLDDRFIVNPEPGVTKEKKTYNQNRSNFIVDPKSGAIIMVLEANAVHKLKELIKKLDVPKKMVQIECLLVEKITTKDDTLGLNLLKIGSCASQMHATCVAFNDIFGAPFVDPTTNPSNAGVFEFLISRVKHSGIPAYDLWYKCLISRDDIQINASPSVVAINQTKATIHVEQEISVSTGIFVIPTEGNPSLKDAFARARYGIKIEVTPTIHMASDKDSINCCEGEANYVTLDSDILFETIEPIAATPQQPNVARRHVLNQVRIEDGQTVIIGGLRQRTTEDDQQSIPFLGEIPGIGRLFSISALRDESREMFIFLTPKIISDPCEDMEKIKRIEMLRRPGDIPEFMCRLVEAQEAERRRLFQGSMTLLLGIPPSRCFSPYDPCDLSPDFCGEYDGR